MATATKAESKSGFIKQVLSKDPYANFKSVNQAWTAAGNEGSISQALVNKLRLEAGLSGNLRTKEKPKTQVATKTAKPKTGKKRGRKPKVRPRDQGKTGFLKEYLNDHPEGSARAVNEAWHAAGFTGTISHTLVSQVRARLGLTGSPTKPSTGKRRGRKPKRTTPTTSRVETRGPRSARTSGLLEMEADLDRLLFKVMDIGDLPQIEESLRQARRMLYGGFSRG
jgi:hypothetical protein